MSPRKHPLVLIAVGTLIFSGLCFAQQSQQKQPEGKDALRSAEMTGTATMQRPLKDKDSIVLLQTERPATTNVSFVARGSGTPLSEIASLQQEIKNKQKRLELLMHMFVADERPFLIDPSSTTADQDTAARRRFEQDELHKNSAEIAILRSRLDQLMSNQQHSASAKQ